MMTRFMSSESSRIKCISIKIHEEVLSYFAFCAKDARTIVEESPMAHDVLLAVQIRQNALSSF